MSFAAWRRIAWTYHIVFAAAVTWPIQTLVNEPRPFVLSLPLNMAWCAGWIVGSLVVMWRLDAARSRHVRQAGP